MIAIHSQLPSLYLVTDRHLTGKRTLAEVITEAMKGGCRSVQLREKNLSDRELLGMAREIRDITDEYGGKLFINDRVDVAILVGADGVHLGSRSFSVSETRTSYERSGVRPSKQPIIGVSIHSLEEAVKAELDGADFITCGPVYFTPSKALYGRPLGIDLLKRITADMHIPVYAIGGIKRHNVREVMEAGADGIALISEVMQAPDPMEATREIILECQAQS